MRVHVQYRTKEGAGNKASAGVVPRHKHLWQCGAFWQMFHDLWFEKCHGMQSKHRGNGVSAKIVYGQGLPLGHRDKAGWRHHVSDSF